MLKTFLLSYPIYKKRYQMPAEERNAGEGRTHRFGEKINALVAGSSQRVNITVVGCGGAGCKMVSGIQGGRGLRTIAVNDDERSLGALAATEKVLFEERELDTLAATYTRFLASVSSPFLTRLKEAVGKPDIAFVLAGLGGKAGSGCAPIASWAARSAGARVVSFLTMPFSVEGQRRAKAAQSALSRTYAQSDLTVPLSNDKLTTLAPDLPVLKAFRIMEEIITIPIQELSFLLTKSDLDDFGAAIGRGKRGQITLGSGKGYMGALSAVEDALASPWLDADIGSCTASLLVLTGRTFDRKELEYAVESLRGALNPSASVFWGAMEHKEVEARATVIVAE